MTRRALLAGSVLGAAGAMLWSLRDGDTGAALLESGVDTVVIALWLGHESVETTQIYIHANLSLKEKALARTEPKDVGRNRNKG